MITTAKRSHWPSDLEIGDLQNAGLKTPSIARWRLITLPNEMILRKLGSIGPVDRLAFEIQRAALLA